MRGDVVLFVMMWWELSWCGVWLYGVVLWCRTVCDVWYVVMLYVVWQARSPCDCHTTFHIRPSPTSE